MSSLFWTVVSNTVGILSFVAGLIELWLASRMRKAAGTATDKALVRMSGSQVGPLVAALHRNERALLKAIMDSDHPLASFALEEWQSNVGQVLPAIKLAGVSDVRLEQLFARSTAHLAVAKQNLADRPGDPVRELVPQAYAAISDVCAGSASLASLISARQIQG